MKQKRILIKNGTINTGRMEIGRGYVVTSGQKIVEVGPEKRFSSKDFDLVLDASGLTVTPGFIDIHIHGGGGGDTTDASPDAIEKICRAHARFGTTALLPTIYAGDFETLCRRLRAVADHIKSPSKGAQNLGSHLEGPYVNPKRKGALRAKHFRKPSTSELYKLVHCSDSSIRMMTMAPELEGGIDFIKACNRIGIKVSVGHSDASFDEMCQAINAGLSHATHIFNALRRVHHRDPGVMGTIFINPEVSVDVIADYYHVHPAVLTFLFMVKHYSRIALVTDALRITGLKGKSFVADGQRVKVVENVAKLPDGTIAGSVLTMNKAVKNTASLGMVPVSEALKMASLIPARVLGIDHYKGSILPDFDADITILDEDFKVHLTMVKGNIVYRNKNRV
jgi:N-acetylglucosamine-6-phosphate deacetylase